jgi:hypothetical protein
MKAGERDSERRQQSAARELKALTEIVRQVQILAVDEAVSLELDDEAADDFRVRLATRLLRSTAEFFGVGKLGDDLDERITEIATTVDEIAADLRK